MSEQQISWRELSQPGFGLSVPTGGRHKVVLELARFEMQLLDAMGESVGGIPLRFGRGEDAVAATTDGEGLAVFRSPTGEAVRGAVADLEEARKTFDQLWQKGRDEKLEEKGFSLLSLQQLGQGLDLEEGRRIIVAVIPYVLRIRLVGLYFETSKSFLLPAAMKGIRRVRTLYDEHPNARVLVVGHADTAGSDSYNMKLSLERAEAIGDFLQDRVEDWLPWYGSDQPEEKRWGTREDQHMLSVLPEGGEPYYSGEVNGSKTAETRSAIERFQGDEGLEVDGVAGKQTHTALIRRYMATDGTSLPSGCELVKHGCGENFPEEPTGDEQASERNRRVEVFFFEGPILPPPPGKTSPKGSLAYPAWRAQVMQTVDASLEGGPVVSAAIAIWFHDHLGRRMGADPSSPDPIAREQGAPYRLSTPDGVVRTGFANAEGMAVEYEVPWNTLCLIQWGKREEAHEQYPPHEEEDADEFYVYSEYVFLGSEPDSGNLILQMLENLGYRGDEPECREVFATDYGSDDDALIRSVHSTGQEKTLA